MSYKFQFCPACNSPVAGHNPPTAEEYENWTFECGAEIIDQETKLVAEEPCKRALEQALEKLQPKAEK